MNLINGAPQLLEHAWFIERDWTPVVMHGNVPLAIVPQYVTGFRALCTEDGTYNLPLRSMWPPPANNFCTRSRILKILLFFPTHDIAGSPATLDDHFQVRKKRHSSRHIKVNLWTWKERMYAGGLLL